MAYPVICGNQTDQGILNRAREQYLRTWDSYLPASKLREALDLATVLAPLHFASAFYFTEPVNAETQWEVDGGLSYYLRKMIYMPGLG